MRSIRTILFGAAFALVLGAMIAPPAAGQTAYNLAVLDSNPAFYWTFDEASGNAIDQVSGLAADDLIPGPSASRVASTSTGGGVSLGSAASFPGMAGSEFSAADLTGAGGQTQWAVEFWTASTAPSEYHYFLGGSNGGNNPAFIQFGGLVQYYADGGGVQNTPGNAPSTSTDWQHFVFVVDSDAQTTDVYVDGAFWGNQVHNNGQDPIPYGPWTVGNFAPGAGFDGAYKGLVDEVAIYDLTGLDLDVAGQNIADHYFIGGDPPAPGDFNNDMFVNSLDAGILRDHLNAHLDGPVNFSDGDFDRNGRIDLNDFRKFLEVYPGGAAALAGTAVPEPSSITLSLCVLAGLAAVARRRGR